MPKAKKKGKSEVDSFRFSCERIVLENKNLNELFVNADRLLEYSLKNSFNFVQEELFNQLEVLGGTDFARLLMFCFDAFDDFAESISLLRRVEINEELIEQMKFILAKYGPTYKKNKARDFNQYGWSFVRNNIVQAGQENFLLEVIIGLNNESIVICRDHPDSMLQLTLHVLEGLVKAKEISPLDKGLIEMLNEKVKLLSHEPKE